MGKVGLNFERFQVDSGHITNVRSFGSEPSALGDYKGKRVRIWNYGMLTSEVSLLTNDPNDHIETKTTSNDLEFSLNLFGNWMAINNKVPRDSNQVAGLVDEFMKSDYFNKS